MKVHQGVFECLNSKIDQHVQALDLPGIAIGVTDHQRLLFVGHYGQANRETGAPISSDTLFQIGSISKSFSSIVLLQLQEQDMLCIDDPVTKYLPWLSVQSEYEPISLRHLMSHTAGIVQGSEENPGAYTEAWKLRHTRATAPPGEMFHYSNVGYAVLGLVLEKVLGQCLRDILQQRVLTPLGMTESVPVFTNADRTRLAVGHQPYYDDRPFQRGGPLAPATWFEYGAADGSICSTAEDMCRYLRSLLNRGSGLIAAESWEQLIHPTIPMDDDDNEGGHYGLGFSVQEVEGHKLIGHSGGMVGFTSDLVADLDAGIGIIVLANGPVYTEEISRYALNMIKDNQRGLDISQFAELDPFKVERAEDYAGIYTCGDKVIAIIPEGDHLFMQHEGQSVRLEPVAADVFLATHPAFERFQLRFNRQSAPSTQQDGDVSPISEVYHGADVYHKGGETGVIAASLPAEWEAFPGYYRSYSPWNLTLRIVNRNGHLILIGYDGDEQELFPIEPGHFRVGDNPHSPESIRFEVVIDGKAMQATISGGVYSRMFSP